MGGSDSFRPRGDRDHAHHHGSLPGLEEDDEIPGSPTPMLHAHERRLHHAAGSSQRSSPAHSLNNGGPSSSLHNHNNGLSSSMSSSTSSHRHDNTNSPNSHSHKPSSSSSSYFRRSCGDLQAAGGEPALSGHRASPSSASLSSDRGRGEVTAAGVPSDSAHALTTPRHARLALSHSDVEGPYRVKHAHQQHHAHLLQTFSSPSAARAPADHVTATSPSSLGNGGQQHPAWRRRVDGGLVTSRADDDDNTTTSGSYTIPPDDDYNPDLMV